MGDDFTLFRDTIPRVAVDTDSRSLGELPLYYYNLRCKLVHERATVPVSDRDLIDYRSVVEKILKRMFGLHF